jgi:hypothetical protein
MTQPVEHICKTPEKTPLQDFDSNCFVSSSKTTTNMTRMIAVLFKTHSQSIVHSSPSAIGKFSIWEGNHIVQQENKVQSQCCNF